MLWRAAGPLASMVLLRRGVQAAAAHILIVDDDPVVRAGLRELFESAGYQISEAICGREALKALEREALPQVIVLDIEMPGMNGVTFRVRQLKNQRIAGVPVIVHSASPSSDTIGEILRAHAFLTKPADAEVLLDTVAQIITRR